MPALVLIGQLQDVFSESTSHTLLAQRLTHKSLMKRHARQHNITCADFLTVEDRVPLGWSYPCVVKTEVGSGSRGLVIANNAIELSRTFKQAIYHLNRQIIQAFGITSGMTHLELFRSKDLCLAKSLCAHWAALLWA